MDWKVKKFPMEVSSIMEKFSEKNRKKLPFNPFGSIFKVFSESPSGRLGGRLLKKLHLDIFFGLIQLENFKKNKKTDLFILRGFILKINLMEEPNLLNFKSKLYSGKEKEGKSYRSEKKKKNKKINFEKISRKRINIISSLISERCPLKKRIAKIKEETLGDFQSKTQFQTKKNLVQKILPRKKNGKPEKNLIGNKFKKNPSKDVIDKFPITMYTLFHSEIPEETILNGWSDSKGRRIKTGNQLWNQSNRAAKKFFNSSLKLEKTKINLFKSLLSSLKTFHFARLDSTNLDINLKKCEPKISTVQKISCDILSIIFEDYIWTTFLSKLNQTNLSSIYSKFSSDSSLAALFSLRDGNFWLGMKRLDLQNSMEIKFRNCFFNWTNLFQMEKKNFSKIVFKNKIKEKVWLFRHSLKKLNNETNKKNFLIPYLENFISNNKDFIIGGRNYGIIKVFINFTCQVFTLFQLDCNIMNSFLVLSIERALKNHWEKTFQKSSMKKKDEFFNKGGTFFGKRLDYSDFIEASPLFKNKLNYGRVYEIMEESDFMGMIFSSFLGISIIKNLTAFIFPNLCCSLLFYVHQSSKILEIRKFDLNIEEFLNDCDQNFQENSNLVLGKKSKKLCFVKIENQSLHRDITLLKLYIPVCLKYNQVKFKNYKIRLRSDNLARFIVLFCAFKRLKSIFVQATNKNDEILVINLFSEVTRIFPKNQGDFFRYFQSVYKFYNGIIFAPIFEKTRGVGSLGLLNKPGKIFPEILDYNFIWITSVITKNPLIFLQLLTIQEKNFNKISAINIETMVRLNPFCLYIWKIRKKLTNGDFQSNKMVDSIDGGLEISFLPNFGPRKTVRASCRKNYSEEYLSKKFQNVMKKGIFLKLLVEFKQKLKRNDLSHKSKLTMNNESETAIQNWGSTRRGILEESEPLGKILLNSLEFLGKNNFLTNFGWNIEYYTKKKKFPGKSDEINFSGKPVMKTSDYSMVKNCQSNLTNISQKRKPLSTFFLGRNDFFNKVIDSSALSFIKYRNLGLNHRFWFVSTKGFNGFIEKKDFSSYGCTFLELILINLKYFRSRTLYHFPKIYLTQLSLIPEKPPKFQKLFQNNQRQPNFSLKEEMEKLKKQFSSSISIFEIDFSEFKRTKKFLEKYNNRNFCIWPPKENIIQISLSINLPDFFHLVIPIKIEHDEVNGINMYVYKEQLFLDLEDIFRQHLFKTREKLLNLVELFPFDWKRKRKGDLENRNSDKDFTLFLTLDNETHTKLFLCRKTKKNGVEKFLLEVYKDGYWLKGKFFTAPVSVIEYLAGSLQLK